MKNYIRILMIFLAVSAAAVSCQNEKNEAAEGNGVAISVSGISTRAIALGGSELYLRAFYNVGNQPYFGETRIDVSNGLAADPHDVIFPITTPYYPFDGQTIRLIAYSGKADGQDMVLTAGNSAASDAVLSNYGDQDSFPADPTVTNGTPGNSLQPAEVLHFRHVMTQLTVDVVVDEDEDPGSVTKNPQKISLTMDAIKATGRYNIRAAEYAYDTSSAAFAHNAAGSYAVQMGVNYLIPTGEELVGKELTSLTIDNYKADVAGGDLAGFTIQPTDPAVPSMKLIPGYAYKMTITVQRLKIASIHLSPVRWATHEEGNQSINNAYNLDLDFSNVGTGTTAYDNTGDNEIRKVVLHSAGGKTYVGASDATGSPLEFITVPADGQVTGAELYTAKGLLLTTQLIGGYTVSGTTATLSLPLSDTGMLPEDTTSAYGPNNPYMVTTPVQLLNVANGPGYYYKQGATIDMSEIVNPDPAFPGLGDFTGVYDGNGYWISEIDIKGTGLFSSNSGTLRNVRLVQGTVDATGFDSAGSICGTNTGTIVACINGAQVIDAGIAAGGICGDNGPTGTLIACLNLGNVRAATIEGGICGRNYNTSTAGAVAANVSGGMLQRATNITNMGGVSGMSVASAAGVNVFRNCFWLVGTATKQFGITGVAVDSPNVGIYSCTALSPEALLNELLPGYAEQDRVVSRLNAELSLSDTWRNEYKFISDRVLTGILWPVPVRGSAVNP